MLGDRSDHGSTTLQTYIGGRGLMTKNTRDVGGHGGLGDRRYQRFCDAFGRVTDCVKERYYLEAIAILDSLICDRLNSRLAYLNESVEWREAACGRLCWKLLDEDGTASKKKFAGKGHDKDEEFRKAIEDIQKWARKRNEALHHTATLFRDKDSQDDFATLLESHKQVAIDGIKYLQAFDKLDTKSREAVSKDKRPASCPHAFFPELRGKRPGVVISDSDADG